MSCTLPLSLADIDGLLSTWHFAPNVDLKLEIKTPLALLVNGPLAPVQGRVWELSAPHQHLPPLWSTEETHSS